MKKALSILICTLILMTTICVVASAENASGNTYNFETKDAHYTVTFEGNNLSAEQQQRIAENLVFGKDDSAQTYGLGCILFGHDYLYDTARVTTHKVYSSAPRCVDDVYEIKTCEDCDFHEETWLYSEDIFCCD
ncbi:MAG: hypothetical protein E7586_03250 [Ruminococcaceae bacterium]|nr:hypothetical protein [Oscillospiraceae bacterium]